MPIRFCFIISEHCRYRLICQYQFGNQTSVMRFSCVFLSIWRESKGVLIRPTPCGPSGPKMLIQVEWGWWVQIVNKAWKFGYKYYLTCQRQPNGILVEKNLWLLHAAAYLSHCCIASAHFIFSIEMSWTGSKVKNKCHLMCWRLLFGKLMEQMFNRLRICGPRLWWK